MIKDILIKNRSYRRYDENVEIPEEKLVEWVNLTRYCASGKNAQPLKYIISCEKEKNKKVFSTLAWAAFLKDWDGPVEGERPTAYIIQMLDTAISSNFFCDDGIAAQSILLAAVEEGFGGCIFRSINKAKLTELLGIPDQFQIINVISLGKPIEKVVIDDLKNDDYKYWREEDGTHHVPKRLLKDILLNI
ncbi:MAG: nitroreductase family protein [Prolixibacteraceae bacterium]|nr:nitroreductase family protein [Prolixibacteraceae bacterium]